MTESEKQEIVSRVLSSLSTNSATIDQLIETGACTDNDYFETGKGNKVSYANMMKPIHQKYDRKFSDLNKDIVKKTTELNISVLYPTGGIGGSNKYDLATAIGKVPEELRVPGLVVSFLNKANKVEKWTYQGGTWAAASFIRQEAGGNKILEWNTDAATTRKQVPANERKAGMQISYKDAEGVWTNEQFVGSDTQDVYWTRDENWDAVASTAYMAKSSFLMLPWKTDLRQTRIQVPVRLRRTGLRICYKIQRPTIVHMILGGYPQGNKGGSFTLEIDGKSLQIKTAASDNSQTRIAEMIAAEAASENWNVSASGSVVVFTSKENGNRTDYPFAYNNFDGCWFDFRTEVKQDGTDALVYEEFTGAAYDDNTFGNINANWEDLSPKQDGGIYDTPYKHNPLLTRMYVPVNFRKTGTVIRYTDHDGRVAEETYMGSGKDNTDWCNSVNWKRGNGKMGYMGNCEYLFEFNKTDWWETDDYETYRPVQLPTTIGSALSTDFIEIDRLGSRVLLFNSNAKPDLLVFDADKKIIPTRQSLSGDGFVNNFSCRFLPMQAKYVRVRRNIGYFEETPSNRPYQLKTFREGDDVSVVQHDIDLAALGYCRERRMLESGMPDNVINSGILTVSTGLFPVDPRLKYLLYGVLPNKSDNTPSLCFYDSGFACIGASVLPYTTANTYTKSMHGYVAPPEGARYAIASWNDVYEGTGRTVLRVVGKAEHVSEYVSGLYASHIDTTRILDYISLGDSISAESGSYTRTVAESLHSRKAEYFAVGGAGFTAAKSGGYWIGKQLEKVPQGYEGVVTLMGGINDWGGKAPLGSAAEATCKTMEDCYNSGTVMDSFRWVLETLVDKCSWKARIFILTQLDRYPDVEAGYTIEQLRVETERLALHYKLPVIDVGRRCGLRNGNSLEEDWRRVDGGSVKVHPTLDGHNIIGGFVAAQIKSMLGGGIRVYPKALQ